MTTCSHQWRQIHEESLLGGSFPIGFRCMLCNKFVGQHELTPAGLAGHETGERELIGPHGNQSRTASGQSYRKQIIRKDGTLEVYE